MDRRDFLAATALLGTAALAGAASATEHGAHHSAAAPADPRLARIAAAAAECVSIGDACVRHCVDLLAKGDTTLAGCLREVLQTSEICESLAALAHQAAGPSPRLVAYARACATYCRDCAAECKKHAEHHAVCRSCQEACERCAEACEALEAA